MKQCRFCFENIHDFAEACAHCGHWQPSPEEVNSAYQEVATRMAHAKMKDARLAPLGFLFAIVILEGFKSGLNKPSIESYRFFLEPLFWGTQIILFFSALVLLFLWSSNDLYKQYLNKITFDEAVAIDELHHKRLKELQITKSQVSTRTLVILVCILILLLIFINARIWGVL